MAPSAVKLSKCKEEKVEHIFKKKKEKELCQ
jgi:hypothetical protein